MDNSKVPNEQRKEIGDLDIFLFSNGQVFSPPRKYHLTADELNYWDSTVNFLARSHYGYMHSSIDLYTVDGKKLQGPMEIENNNAYVAVETNDDFLPGGYDQYLMKASKSWIKRYGGVFTGSSMDRLNEIKVPEAEKTTPNAVIVQEVIKKKTAAAPISEILNSKILKHNETPETADPRTINKPSNKQPEKKKLQRSSILRKFHTNSQTNDKKSPVLQKKRISSPKINVPVNKSQTRKTDSQQLKTLYLPSKSKAIASELALGNMILDKSSVKNKANNELNLQQEDFNNTNKSHTEDVDTVDPDMSKNIKQNITSNKLPKNTSENMVSETLETIVESSYDSRTLESTNKPYNDITMKEPFSTAVKLGDAINLRLCIEVNNNTTETIKKGEKTTLPTKDNNEQYDKLLSSQLNPDEIRLQKEIMDNLLDDVNKIETGQKYVILYCNCCHNYFHELGKFTIGTPNNEIKHIDNKDYVVLLPATKNDEDIFGCKCDEALPKSNKSVQTSMIFQTYSDKKSSTKNVEHSNNNMVKTNVENINDACIDECKKRQVLDFTVKASKESQIMYAECLQCVNKPKRNENEERNSVKAEKLNNIIKKPSREIQITNTDCSACLASIPKGDFCEHIKKTPRNDIQNTEFQDCTSIPNGRCDMLDKSTQTDFLCLLLEARRQIDGHFSFHLPPLHIVKLYQNQE